MRRILVTSALLVAACASDASSGGAAPAPQPPPGGCTLSVAFGLKRTGDAFTPFPASGGGAPVDGGSTGAVLYAY